MLFYMACGFCLSKFGKVKVKYTKYLSGILIYIGTPCMILSSFQSIAYSKENIFNMVMFFIACMAVQLMFYGILYILLHKKYDDAKYRILTIGTILGNVGFFGLPLVTSLFPENPEVACYSTLYVTGMNLLIFTIGIFMITNDKKYMSVKSAFLNPTVLAAAIAIPLYFLQVHLPTPAIIVVSIFGKLATPVCMIILGFRLSTMKFKSIFSHGFVYVLSALKLIVFPLFAYLCVYFLPWFDDVFKVSLFVLCATPSAAIILSLAELHNCEQEFCADTVLLTTLLSLVTLPLMMLIV